MTFCFRFFKTLILLRSTKQGVHVRQHLAGSLLSACVVCELATPSSEAHLSRMQGWRGRFHAPEKRGSPSLAANTSTRSPTYNHARKSRVQKLWIYTWTRNKCGLVVDATTRHRAVTRTNLDGGLACSTVPLFRPR